MNNNTQNFLTALLISCSMITLIYLVGEGVTFYKFFVLYMLNAVGLKLYEL